MNRGKIPKFFCQLLSHCLWFLNGKISYPLLCDTIGQSYHFSVSDMIYDSLFTDLLKYSVLFGIIMGFILYIFLKYRRGFVWRTDGLEQHYITLKYFRELLKNFITTGEFSTFIWNIGNGMDMFGNLAYYSFGDVFSYLSIFSPEKYLKWKEKASKFWDNVKKGEKTPEDFEKWIEKNK